MLRAQDPFLSQLWYLSPHHLRRLREFECEIMLERQREGIAKAKAENRYMGRRPSARLKADEAVKLFKAGRSVTDIATALNIGRGSVYRAH